MSAPIVVVCGVSGSGKSTVGAALAAHLGVPFVDADSLHPAANVAKMAAGIPLDDSDRWPWLDAVGDALCSAPAGLVVACSALRSTYRTVLRHAAPTVRFVQLTAEESVLSTRMLGRDGHFMPPALLDSQLATLEPLHRSEPGVVIDASLPVDEIVEKAARAVM